MSPEARGCRICLLVGFDGFSEGLAFAKPRKRSEALKMHTANQAGCKKNFLNDIVGILQ
jgi:hypothetical protein